MAAASPPSGYTPSRAPFARVQRRMVQWRRAAPAVVAPDRPVVTFTFDDFPKSAVAGADIVEAAGGRAGFYASTTMAGTTHPDMGEMFDANTLADLVARGHEIGAHSHEHLDCARISLGRVEVDVGENLVALAGLGLEAPVSSFAWPYGETGFAAKRWAASVFSTCRGVLPGVNVGDTDRAQLRAIELGPTEAHQRRALELLSACIAMNGWAIFFTHDVSDAPSDYGCTPDLLRELVKAAVDQGAVLAAPGLAAALCGVTD